MVNTDTSQITRKLFGGLRRKLQEMIRRKKKKR